MKSEDSGRHTSCNRMVIVITMCECVGGMKYSSRPTLAPLAAERRITSVDIEMFLAMEGVLHICATAANMMSSVKFRPALFGNKVCEEKPTYPAYTGGGLRGPIVMGEKLIEPMGKPPPRKQEYLIYST